MSGKKLKTVFDFSLMLVKEVSNFCLRKFGDIGLFWGQNVADVDIITKNTTRLIKKAALLILDFDNFPTFNI